MKKNNYELPLIGFMAPFDDLGETYPLVEIAKKYIDFGGKVVFFGYGTRYQHLTKEINCKVINFTSDFSETNLKIIAEIRDKIEIQQLPPEKFLSNVFNKNHFKSHIRGIEKQVKAFKEAEIKLIITGYDYLCNISTRILKIPLICIVSGASIPIYYQQNLANFPDNYENFFIRLVPGFIKNRLSNWYILYNKRSVKEFNKLANKFNTPKINHFLDLFLGDYTLIAEDSSFLNIKPTMKFPVKNFVGPILPKIPPLKNENNVEIVIKKHLERPGRSILVSLGSSGTKKLFLKILKALENIDYNVIAVYTTILNKNEIPNLKENILLVQFISSIKKLNESVDVAIINGGRGTVYTAAYSGKPVIGIPIHIEQQCNIDNLVRHGTAIRLSKRNFTTKKLLTNLEKIFKNYDLFFKNAQLLKEKLQGQNGAENTVKRLFEIIKEKKI